MREFQDLEIWLPVPGSEAFYEVSNQGRVRSLDVIVPAGPGGVGRRFVKGRILKPGTMNRYGHVSVAIGKGNSRCVHDLVLSAFDGPKPEGHEARQLDLDGSNNRLINLLWGSKSENSKDVTRAGRRKYTYEEAERLVSKAKERQRLGGSLYSVAIEEDVNPGQLWKMVEGRLYIR